MPSENEFGERVALVTGVVGGGFGSTTCRTLASYGAGIMVLDSHRCPSTPSPASARP